MGPLNQRKKAGDIVAANTNDLHEYLQDVLDIEGNLYILQKLSEQLHCKLNGVQLLEYPNKPAEPKAPNMIVKKNGVLIKIILGAIGVVVAYRMWHLEESDVPSFFAEHPGIIVFLWLALCVFSVLAIGGGIGTWIANRTANSENKQSVQKFEKAIENYKRNLSTWQDRIIRTKITNNKLQAQCNVLQANINAIEKQFASSLLTLDKLYSANIIHPKYRNLSAVSSLYEYIDTGRCSQLEGPHGAYNLFESEVRLDHILLKMDEVIEKLESIRQSQYQLYTAVTEGNRRAESLLESVAQDIKAVSASENRVADQLTDIAATEKVVAYNTERTQKELEYFNRMRYRLGDYDKVWFNRRP